MDSIWETRLRYERGLETAESEAAGNWRDSDARMRAERVFRVWRDETTWAYQEPDGAVRALEEGAMTDACLVLQDPYSAQKAPAMLHTNTDMGRPATFIAPRPVTTRWAGVALFHEIGHLYDFLHGGESWDPTPDEWFAGEARAFRSEMALVDAMEKGELLRVIDGLLIELPNRTPKRWLQKLRAWVTVVDEALHFEPPASPSERGQREAFYAVALLFRLSEKERLSPSAQGVRDRTDLEALRAYC